jgi:Methylene-tetrahydrofolate reductase C terminal
MLISKQKPIEEILSSLNDEQNIFLMGCKGCAEGFGSGGEQQVLEMKTKLEENGKTVTGYTMFDMLCDEPLVKTKLKYINNKIGPADSLLILCCGVGVQTVATLTHKVVHPGCNTLSLGGAHAEWREAERCMECGDCVLDYTGGLCPIARCSKHLLHGPCGGSHDGMCEVSSDIPCVWHLIVDRLGRQGRLNKLKELRKPKNWGLGLIAGSPKRLQEGAPKRDGKQT